VEGHAAMPASRAINLLPAMLVRALAALPPMLLATALAAAHAEQASVADLAVQATLLVLLAALLVNVIVSVVAILRDRDRYDGNDEATCGLAPGREYPATDRTEAARAAVQLAKAPKP